LREKLQVLSSSVNSLEKIVVAPRAEVIERVLSYARKTAIQEHESISHP